jgi:hypothetical protein
MNQEQDECDCPYTKCPECDGMILLGEKFCITCLLNQTKKLIEDSENTFKDW